MKAKYQQNPQDDLKIIVARNLEEIESIRSVWEEMQRNEPFPTPNADINRYIATVKALGSQVQPHIILLKQNDQSVAIIIGRLERRRLNLRLGYKTLFNPTLRCLSVVYGGIIGRPTSDLCTVLIRELRDMLRRREADAVFFNHLRIESEIYKLCKTVPSFLVRSQFTSPQLHWQTHIPESVESFYKTIPSKHKREWRRCERKLEKMGGVPLKVVCYRQLSDVEYFIDVASRIEAATYKNYLEVGFINSAVTRPLLEQAAKDGWLRAYILYVGDDPCAFELDIQYGNTQFAEQASFDPKWKSGSPGIVLWVKVLEELCREPKIYAADYGFGDALYKRQFGTNCWLGESVYIFAMRLQPIVINMLRSMLLGCFLLLRRVTTCLNLESWVKRNWRKIAHKKNRKDNTQGKE